MNEDNRRMTTCGVRFEVYYPPFPSQMTCELERWHEGPHQFLGFAWGPLDQTQDFQVQRMREPAKKRQEKVRGWYKLKGDRG